MFWLFNKKYFLYKFKIYILFSVLYGNRVSAFEIVDKKYSRPEGYRLFFILENGVQDCDFGKNRILKFNSSSYSENLTKKRDERSNYLSYFLLDNKNFELCKKIHILEKTKKDLSSEEIIELNTYIDTMIETLLEISFKVSLSDLEENTYSSFSANELLEKKIFSPSALENIEVIEGYINTINSSNNNYLNNLDVFIQSISDYNNLKIEEVEKYFCGLSVGSAHSFHKLSLIECIRYNPNLFYLVKKTAIK